MTTGKLLHVGNEYIKEKFSIFVKDHQTNQSGYVMISANLTWELTDDIANSSTWYKEGPIFDPIAALNYIPSRWPNAEFIIVYLTTHVKVEKYYSLEEAKNLCKRTKIKDQIVKLQEELRLLELELAKGATTNETA